MKEGAPVGHVRIVFVDADKNGVIAVNTGVADDAAAPGNGATYATSGFRVEASEKRHGFGNSSAPR